MYKLILSNAVYDSFFLFFSCSMICLLQLISSQNFMLIFKWYRSYYRLGKNRPSSGNFVRVSLSALNFHIIAVTPKMTTPKIAVFPFQFEGCEYQPPDGDQTCLGYLKLGKNRERRGRCSSLSSH
jgi:hypothetical protein